MALNKQRDSHMEALILRAAEDARRLNPHIGAPQQAASEAEYAEIERERLNLERAWDDMERQRGGSPMDEPAARAVDEDRGE